MAECPDGRKNRGTRSQFRIGLPGLKGFYPISLGKVMDAGQSTQISSSSPPSRDLTSPYKGTHTLTVREYEQTIDVLQKENFNLKLKLYLCEENHKTICRDEDSVTPNDNMVQVVVQLSSEAESLRAELKEKDELLKDALERVEKLSSYSKELEEMNADLQSKLTSFSELPSKEEIFSLLEEKENFVNQIESLENIIKEKEEEIITLNDKIEIVANENTHLDEKIKKRNLAIQSFVHKSYKEKEMLPNKFKEIAISAIQAAKNKNEEELALAVKIFNSSLNELVSSASKLSLNQSEEKENIGSPKVKCLNEETLEKPAESFLSSQTLSPCRIAQIQGLKEVLSERNTSDTKQTKHLDSFVHQQFVKGKTLHQSAVNIAEIDTDFYNTSFSHEERLLSFSPNLQTFSGTEYNLTDSKAVLSSPTFCKLIPEKDTPESNAFVHILNENEQLKDDLKEKLATIEDLRAEFAKQVFIKESDAFKASQQYCVSTQTEISGKTLLNENEIIKCQTDAKLSDNVEELREDILLLLLAIEEKNGELSEVKQSLIAVQEDLKKALNTTNILEKDYYLNERNDLHEKLALSSSVNEELMKQLKDLERFMENLLQNKFDSTLESFTDKSDFMCSVSKCLSKSLNLSKILSDHLSICEGSKLFEECESFAEKKSICSEEKDLPHLGLDRLSLPEQQLFSHGSRVFEECNLYSRKSSLRTEKESDSSQLCWRCWQQLNQSEVTHLMQNNVIPKPIRYQSSDSDIWSEPDRNISMQRIGISLQNSPVSSKSPRKLRQKDKRISSRTSSKENTSSNEYQQACKKRLGSVPRRLFAKESAKIQDFALEKFNFLVDEKYSKLKSLLDNLENIKSGNLSDNQWIRLNSYVFTIGEVLQKLYSAKENPKISPVCVKCMMLDLFSKLEASSIEKDFYTEETSSEMKIFQEFSKELCALKEACREPFPILYESVDKRTVASQSDTLIEGSEQIKKLENVINRLNAEKNELDENFKKVNQLLSKETEALVSAKIKNSNLLTEIDNLKIDLLDMKYKDKELLLKNEKLSNELTHANRNAVELNNTVKDLEQNKKESSITIDQLTTELQKLKSDLIHMNEKCLEYEKQLNEQVHIRENCENKLKDIESDSLNEKEMYLYKINSLNVEKDHYIQELKVFQERNLALEKENAVINDRLQSKNDELLFLKETIEKFQSIKDTKDDIENECVSKENILLKSIEAENSKLLNRISHLKEELLDITLKEKESSLENTKLIAELDRINKKYSELNSVVENFKQEKKEYYSATDQLKAELEKNRLDLDYMNKKCLGFKQQLDEQIEIKEKYANEIKTLKLNLSSEKESQQNQLDELSAEKNQYKQELQDIQEKLLSLDKENAIINSSLESKNVELLSLQNAMEELQRTNESLIFDHEETKKLLLKVQQSSKLVKIENLKLSNQINILEKELLHLKSFGQEKSESNIALDQLTYELQKNKSDLIFMNEKCLEYEKQLNEQVHMRENCENKLKDIEFESLSEKKKYLSKIDNLNAEKDHYIQELKVLQEKNLALEKENTVIKDRLQSTHNELMILKETTEKFIKSIKNTKNDVENECVSEENILLKSIEAEKLKLLNQVSHLKEELLNMTYKEKQLALENKKLIGELDQINKKYSELNSTIDNLKQEKKESSFTADQVKAQLQNERQTFLNKLDELNTEKNHYEEELKNTQGKMQVLEKESAVIYNDLQSKRDEILSLQEIIEKHKNVKETLFQEHEKTKILLSDAKMLSESTKTENLELLNQISKLKDELSHLKNKEKEFSLKNEELVKELNEVNVNNSKLNNILEEERKNYSLKLNQLTAELEKNNYDIGNLSEKCLIYEKQLSEQIQLKEKYENDLRTQESNLLNENKHYLSQIKELNAEKCRHLKELKSMQENKLELEKEITAIKYRLDAKNDELLSLQKTVDELQKAKETLDFNYKKLQNELINNQDYLTKLQNKFKETEADYCQQLKQLEAKSATEKENSLREISVLTTEKEGISQKLKDKKEQYKKLKAENIELNESKMKNHEQISILKQRNEFFEKSLLSSNKECDKLNKDLKCLRGTLQDLESKCIVYEKQLAAAAGVKDSLTNCLLNINNEFSIQRMKLNEMCKTYGNDIMVGDETSFSKLLPVMDKDNVSKLCNNIVLETKKLSQYIDMMLCILKKYNSKSTEIESSEEKNQLKEQIEMLKIELKNARLQMDQFQLIIDELQKSVLEKEKSIKSNIYEIKTLAEKLQQSQKEVDRINHLINTKDDEITMLQERIFNLQTYVNTILTDKKNVLEKTMQVTEKLENSIISTNLLPSKAVSTDTKISQTDEYEDISSNVAESFTSVSSLENVKNHCCEKYWKKCQYLQTKLAFCQKHTEILEKDKNDLKEEMLQRLQHKNYSVNGNESTISKLNELESKLEKKNLFISELKGELLNTYNALIDKEKEIDDLKQKLTQCKINSKHKALDVFKDHPTATLSSVDTNVETLKKHKWDLIQTIFDIQRKFYEKKGIHLNYFDNFKEHVNNLYSLQLIPSMFKSESMPLLKYFEGTLKERHGLGNEKVRKIADLELDIECLENLKIFLNRFLVPCVFQMPETSNKGIGVKQMTVSSNLLSVPLETEKQTESRHEIADILNLSFPEVLITDDKRALSIDAIAFIITQHLDCIKRFSDAVTKKNWCEILDFSLKGSINKEEVEIKSLLLKIFHEISILHKGTDKLFQLNTCLKNFDSVASLPASFTTAKLDVSDRESVMSEETIAVSRTESPMSFEDTCPIKLPHPETLQLEENTLKLQSVGNRVMGIDPYNNKLAVVEGSCDSVCQRSHYSSPDLGIESDPNHDSSAPEHKEDRINKYQKFIRGEQVFPLKPQPKTVLTNTESASRWPGPNFGETFYAISTLPHFELLKQEIKESLVAIKSVLSRTGDGLHHIAKYTSPRKTLEYNTLKSIKDTCVHMDVCLNKANSLIGNFWTAPCPTEKEWKMLKEENQKLSEELGCLKTMIDKQENDFKTAMGKLHNAQAVKDNMEKKISKKLVKTKKLIRQAELKLLETRCQNFPAVPKYSSEQTDTRHHHTH